MGITLASPWDPSGITNGETPPSEACQGTGVMGLTRSPSHVAIGTVDRLGLGHGLRRPSAPGSENDVAAVTWPGWRRSSAVSVTAVATSLLVILSLRRVGSLTAPQALPSVIGLTLGLAAISWHSIT